jgi:hypothetical protein
VADSMGRKCLRELEGLGEYHGFTRKSPKKYRRTSKN